ncbi:MAG: plastocyanin/azurin family copper-binding protein [Actinomycetota bacterium]|nr:plastocyanin/azurin family copper-binding protein [Actinomycetota bacterium]
MRLHKGYVPLAAVLGASVAVVPASFGTSPTIEALNEGFNHRWSPTQVSVAAAGAVTIRNSTEVPHGVEWRSGPIKPSCEEGPGKVPVGTTPAASGTKWSGACTFTQAGTYTFFCTVHGSEMTSTITVNTGGTTTTTTTTTGTTTTGTTTTAMTAAGTNTAGTNTTTTTPAPSGEESLLVGPASQALKLLSSQHGGSVRATLDISRAAAGGRLEVELFAKSASLATARHGVRVRVGRLVRSSVSAGRVSLSVRLDPKARRAIKRRGRLAVTVKIVLRPVRGASLTVIRSVVEHR